MSDHTEGKCGNLSMDTPLNKNMISQMFEKNSITIVFLGFLPSCIILNTINIV